MTLRIVDQHTRGLVLSDDALNFRRRLAAALLTTDRGDEKIAIGQDFAHTATRRRDAFVRALEVVALKRERGDSHPVAIGEGLCCPPGPNTQVQCTIDNRRMCDYDRVGNRTLTTAGNAQFTLEPQPGAGYSFWRPKMVRGWAHLTSNPSIPAWEGLFITNITVGSHPVEGFSTAPAAGVQDGIAFGDYVVPTTDAVPVGWPVFSNEANSNQLVITGIGLWPAASAYIAYITVLGNARKALDGNDCRVHPDGPRIPPVAGNGSVTTGYRPT